MLDNELLKFQQEIGELKQNLLTNATSPDLEDEDSYVLATKIDLTVSRLLRILDYK